MCTRHDSAFEAPRRCTKEDTRVKPPWTEDMCEEGTQRKGGTPEVVVDDIGIKNAELAGGVIEDTTADG